ncbi:10668_t:CDS:2 [Entrophospora sp. SA101]|nr:7250_t:CDS:2 [Entrophospora sp. SA101]CAJ0882553.1 10668_t:CDS:2 [Entrophospora sp. SA101]
MVNEEKAKRESASCKPHSNQMTITLNNLLYLNQAQVTYGLNSPQYQELVREQKEAIAVLEKASEAEQKEYLALIQQLQTLLAKTPNLSAPEQQRIITFSQEADEFTEQLKIQQQQKTNLVLWVCGGLVDMTNREDSSKNFDEPMEIEKEVENTKRIDNWKAKIGTTTYCEEIFDRHSVDSGHTTLIRELAGKVRELTEENQDLQTQLEESKKLLDNLNKSREDTEKEIKDKKKELQKLKEECLEKRGNYSIKKLQEQLERLLEAQMESSSYANKHKEEIKKKLIKKTSLIIEEIDDLCQAQEELIQLEMKRGAVELGINKIEERITIINNRITITNSNINSADGHVLIGTSMGNNVNMSYENYSDPIQRELREKIESLEDEIKRLNELLKEQEKENSQSTKRTEKLINLIKQQKEKIVQAYLHFAPEKELLRELIIENELTNKLDEKQMEEIELILSDCDELVRTELEVAEQLQSKIDIEYDQKTFTIGNINVQQGHAMIGNTFGDNTNLSYNRSLIELPEIKAITLPITEEEQNHLITRAKRQLSIPSQTDRENNKEIKIDNN